MTCCTCGLVRHFNARLDFADGQTPSNEANMCASEPDKLSMSSCKETPAMTSDSSSQKKTKTKEERDDDMECQEKK